MSDMTKMQKVVLLLTFWFTPPTEEKYQYWIDFVRDLGGEDIDLNEDEILAIIGDVTVDDDESYVNWPAFDPFVEETNRNMH